MQKNFGGEHFILHRPSQRIKEMQEQMIYGNVVLEFEQIFLNLEKIYN